MASDGRKAELLLHTDTLVAPQIISTVLIVFATVAVNLLYKKEILSNETLKGAVTNTVCSWFPAGMVMGRNSERYCCHMSQWSC